MSASLTLLWAIRGPQGARLFTGGGPLCPPLDPTLQESSEYVEDVLVEAWENCYRVSYSSQV